MLVLWGILTVEVVHPLMQDVNALQGGVWDGCERCPRAFENVLSAMLTYTQQIVAGDSWGLVIIPIMEEYPITSLIFLAVLVTLELGLMNLILTVIVDKAQQAHAEDKRFWQQVQQEKYEKAKQELKQLCEDLDEDGSKTLTLPELVEGFHSVPAFRENLASMDIREEEVTNLFKILDSDGSGDLEYDEFVDQLYKMKTQDSQMLLIFLKSSITEIREQIDKQVIAQLQEVERRLRAQSEKSDSILSLLTKSQRPCEESNNNINELNVISNEKSSAANQKSAQTIAGSVNEKSNEVVSAKVCLPGVEAKHQPHDLPGRNAKMTAATDKLYHSMEINASQEVEKELCRLRLLMKEADDTIERVIGRPNAELADSKTSRDRNHDRDRSIALRSTALTRESVTSNGVGQIGCEEPPLSGRYRELLPSPGRLAQHTSSAEPWGLTPCCTISEGGRREQLSRVAPMSRV